MNKKYKLKDIIKELDLSQKEFAEKIGYTESYISKIANGKQPFTKDVKNRICDVFKYRIEQLSEKDDAVILYEKCESIFRDMMAVPKGKKTKYLKVNMNEHLYKLLINIDSAKQREEQGGVCFEEEFEKFMKEFLEHPASYKDYMILPCEDVFNIIEEESRRRKSVEEILNLSNDIEDYFDNDSEK